MSSLWDARIQSRALLPENETNSFHAPVCGDRAFLLPPTDADSYPILFGYAKPCRILTADDWCVARPHTGADNATLRPSCHRPPAQSGGRHQQPHRQRGSNHQPHATARQTTSESADGEVITEFVYKSPICRVSSNGN